jgi:hypothetical protein
VPPAVEVLDSPVPVPASPPVEIDMKKSFRIARTSSSVAVGAVLFAASAFGQIFQDFDDQLCLGSGTACTSADWSCCYETWTGTFNSGRVCTFCVTGNLFPTNMYCTYFPNKKCRRAGVAACGANWVGTCLAVVTPGGTLSSCINAVRVTHDGCSATKCTIPVDPATGAPPPVYVLP